MKCSACKVNTAMIYVTKIEDGKQKKMGLCLPCAQKQGLAPLEQIMEQSGMTSEDFNNINEQMQTLFEDIDMDSLPSNLFNTALGVFSPSYNNDQDESEADETDEFDSDQIKSQTKTKTKTINKKKKRKNLDTYGINLTDRAKAGDVDRIIGRNREIDRAIQILNRRTKNNPVLIGEPGVGKTAIAEGFAVRIVEKHVPAKLLNKEIYLLDLAAIVAGTQFRGQFEARMKAIIKEATEEGNIILVIDELHNIVGAGDAEGGSMNAANILKPSLARGEIQVIGATTLEEYRKHIEKDAALERRFQPIIIDEPSIEESIEILKGIKSYYEDYHKVKISNEIIEYAVKMSERYINDRYLPDKAIDVIDEAGSRANLKNKGLVELEALKQELLTVISDKEVAASNDDYEKAAECRIKELRITDKIADIEKECKNVEITFDDIAYVIEAWTKIPIQSISENEANKLINLEERLHKRVIGQNEAVTKLSQAMRRSRSGFRKRKKPASFIFVGPTGVGKTELTKALSTEIFNNEEAIIRFDMSEFMEKHTVSKLIGAPPGYIGFDQAGQLTEKVRRKPYSIILLDEIEKAHPDIFNLLLQVLEDGRLTDSQGRTVNFENTIIIMTSNAGTSLKAHSIGFGKTGYESLSEKTNEALKQIFRPEFLNRVDETIVFTELDKSELRQIVDLMIKEVKNDAKDKKINIKVSEEVKDYILEKGYDIKFGARPLRRTIQRLIEDELSEKYIKGELTENSTVEFDMEDSKIKITIN